VETRAACWPFPSRRSCETCTIDSYPRCLIFESMSERREGVRSHLESPDQGSGDYSDAPSRATSRREIRDALLHPVPTVFDSAVTRYLRRVPDPRPPLFATGTLYAHVYTCNSYRCCSGQPSPEGYAET